MPANLENSALAAGLENVSFHSNPKERQCKECSNYGTIALISHASKVMLKILQARLQQYMNFEFPDVHVGFRKGRGTSDQIANICWIIKNAREFQKNIYFCFIDYASRSITNTGYPSYGTVSVQASVHSKCTNLSLLCTAWRPRNPSGFASSMAFGLRPKQASCCCCCCY